MTSIGSQTVGAANRAVPGDPVAPRIFLFGTFRIIHAGREIHDADWKLRKSAAVVKLLLLAPGRTLLRDQLVEALWPELDERAGWHNLNQALYVARRMLAGDAMPARETIQRRGDALVMFPNAALWIDVDAFEELAERAIRAGDISLHREALALYTGDLLPADLYEEWTREPRHRLRERRMELLLNLGKLLAGQGQLDAATETLELLAREDPLHEEARLELIRLRARRGQRGQALREYQELERVLRAELDIEPSPEVQTLYQEIQIGSFPAEQAAPPAQPTATASSGNLPARMTSFIGRWREIAELHDSISRHRLTTLLGAAGSGKTRLAIEAAAGESDTFPDGVWLVELASLADAALIPESINSVLRIPEVRGQPAIETLVVQLRSARALLVLDNCEHLMDGCAAIARKLLGDCPGLRVLATSRQSLRVPGEAIYQVPPLSAPGPDDVTGAQVDGAGQLLRYEAVQLFVERAGLVQQGFAPDASELRAIATVCRRLDGIPLAIELAAARVNVLAVGEIARRLDDRFRLLTSGPRTAPDRHRSLRAAVEWSYDLLPERERDAFDQLAIFSGGFTLEGAEALWAASADPEFDPLALLAGLVERSLIAIERQEDGETRYRLLETMREYGQQRLRERGAHAACERRHAHYYMALAERLEPRMIGRELQRLQARVERELDNIRAALRWSLGAGGEREIGLRLAGALWRFWWLRGHFAEGRSHLEALLAHPDAAAPTAARARALYALAVLIYRHADYEAGDQAVARALFEECQAIYRDTGDPGMVAACLRELGRVAIELGEYDVARPVLEEALAIERELGDSYAVALTVSALAWRALFAGEYEAVAPYIAACLPEFEAVGDVLYIGISHFFLGRLYTDTGDYERAYTHLATIINELPVTAIRWAFPITLEGFARLAAAQGQHERAVRLAGAAVAHREAINASLGPSWQLDLEARLLPSFAALGSAAADYWEQGRRLTTAESSAYALGQHSF